MTIFLISLNSLFEILRYWKKNFSFLEVVCYFETKLQGDSPSNLKYVCLINEEEKKSLVFFALVYFPTWVIFRSAYRNVETISNQDFEEYCFQRIVSRRFAFIFFIGNSNPHFFWKQTVDGNPVHKKIASFVAKTR